MNHTHYKRLASRIATISIAVLLVTSGMALPTLAASDGLSFFDGFEDEPADSGAPDPWEVSRDTGAHVENVTTKYSYEGSQSFYLEAGSNSIQRRRPAQQPYDSTVTRSVSLAINQQSGGTSAIRVLEGGEAKIYAGMKNGDLQYFDGSGWVTISTVPSQNEWVEITMRDVDPSTNTYAVDWETSTDSGTATGLDMMNPMSEGYNEAALHSFDAKSVFDAYDTGRPKRVSGYVDTTDGRPVDNATVQVTGAEFDNFTGTQSEIDETVKELEAEINNVKPKAYVNQSDLQPSRAVPTDTTYVAAHSPTAWGVPSYYDDKDTVTRDSGIPALSFSDGAIEGAVNDEGGAATGPYGGANPAPAGEPIILSAWDGEAGDLLSVQDGVESDLPGAVDDDTDIVVEKLGPGGDTVRTRTLETDTTYNVIFGGEHDYASTTLSVGIYRVYPEGSPANSYILPVGSENAIEAAIDGWQTELENQQGALSDRAQRLEDLEQEGKFEFITTSTNSTGYYAVTLDSSTINRTHVQAYKIPEDAPVEPQNATLQDARTYYEELNNSQDVQSALDAPSMYVSEDTESVQPPANDANVTVREISAEPYVGLNRTDNIATKLAEYLFDRSFSDLNGLTQEYLTNLPREDLEELYQRDIDITEDSQSVRDEAENELNNGGNTDWDADPADLNADELKDRIRALETTIEEQQDTIDSSGEVGETTNETVSVAFEFGRDLGADDVAVYAEYSNGTTKLVNESYYTVDSSAIPGGGTEVSVSEYPVDSTDPAAVTFRTDVLDEGESGSESVTARNPSFTGEIPALESISLSSLSPGPDETVSVNAEGRSGFGSVQSVDVTGPDGQSVATTLDNGEATFDTAGEGRHTVDVTYSNSDGDQFTERVDIKAIGADIDQPATVRAENGIAGPYALTGDDLTSGEIQTSQGNSQVTAIGEIGAGEDPPNTIHTHVTTLDTPRRAAITTRITQAPDDTVVRQRTTVITHLNDVGEDAHIYRRVDGELQPITADGNQYGSVSTENGTTVSTYSGADGEVTIEYVSNPNFAEDIQWRIENFEESLPNLPFTVGTPTGLIA